MTKLGLPVNHREYLKKKVADIEVHEKGTRATPLIISCGPALQGFSSLVICSNYALSF